MMYRIFCMRVLTLTTLKTKNKTISKVTSVQI